MNCVHESGGGQRVSLDIETDGEMLRVHLPDGTTHIVSARRLTDGVIEIRANDRVFRMPLVAGKNGAVSLAWRGSAHTFQPARTATTPGRETLVGVSGILSAPMTGVVAEVRVAPGDRVEAFQPVATIEAMKVLATLEAPFAGVVSAVHVRKGDRVDQSAPVIEIEAAETP